MKLVEIFSSLQGEGRNTGRPCVFVRLAGCNLKCPWCDTAIEPRFEMTPEEIVAEVKTYREKSVILTGGEPTIHAGIAELVKRLKAEGYWVAIETNGTTDHAAAPWLAELDYVACSPKAEFPETLKLERADEVRVVASEEHLEFCRGLKTRIAASDYYVSPCDREGEIDFATAKALLGKLDGWSLSVQLHKILGFR